MRSFKKRINYTYNYFGKIQRSGVYLNCFGKPLGYFFMGKNPVAVLFYVTQLIKSVV